MRDTDTDWKHHVTRGMGGCGVKHHSPGAKIKATLLRATDYNQDSLLSIYTYHLSQLWLAFTDLAARPTPLIPHTRLGDWPR